MTTSDDIDNAVSNIYRAINVDDKKTDPMIRSAAISAVKLFSILVKDINRIADAVKRIERQ